MDEQIASYIKAHFTLGVSQKNLGANFEHFWVANWPQVTRTINATTFEFRILLKNAGTLTPGVANWPPKFDGILFSA